MLLEVEQSQSVKYLDIIESILDNNKTGLHVNKIAEIISDLNKSKIPIDEIIKKVTSVLATNVKKKDSRFARVLNGKTNSEGKESYKRGYYRLKKKTVKVIPPPFNDVESTTDTGFIGKAGEYAVMSELLFLGFNVSLMTVDKGIDVVAANELGKYFHIQVKTANAKEGNFLFSLRRKSFDANDNSNTFYVFVLRDKNKCNFLVVPNSIISDWLKTNVIKGLDNISIKISYESKTRKYILNNKYDVTIRVNGFGQIK